MHFFSTLVPATLVSATSFSVTVFAPGTDVDGAHLDALDQAFYAGVSGPATYCPVQPAYCPEVRGTLVYAGLTAMAVEVPGGQHIYVHPSGHVRYTAAHSSSVPPGSFVDGWYNKTIVQDFCRAHHDTETIVLDYLSPDGSGFGGVTLCREEIPDFAVETTTGGAGGSYYYSLYAKTRDFDATAAGCVDAVGLQLVAVGEDVGCWEYT